MRDVGRFGMGASWWTHGRAPSGTLLQRWRAWVPLVGLAAVVLGVGLSGGSRTAREPVVTAPASRVDLEPAVDRKAGWEPAPAVEPVEPVVDKPVSEPAQVSPAGHVLKMMGPPLVIEVRVPRSKSHPVKK